MASHSGIRASGSRTGEYIKRIVLKDAVSYGPWRAKLTSILDAEECWEIVNGTELEPDEIAIVEDDSDEDLPDNISKVVAREIEIKTIVTPVRGTRWCGMRLSASYPPFLSLLNPSAACPSTGSRTYRPPTTTTPF